MARRSFLRRFPGALVRNPLLLVMPLLLAATAVLFFLEYQREEQRVLESTRAAFGERLSGLEMAIEQTRTYLELAGNWAESYWQTAAPAMLYRQYAGLLAYSQRGDYFTTSPAEGLAGNVFGSGQPVGRTGDFNRDLGLAISLMPWFRAAAEESDAIVQSYFVSATNICSAYPPIPPKALLAQVGGDMTAAFASFWGPHGGKYTDPARQPYFLDPYVDRTGRDIGLLVTYARPTYEGERFVGIVAADVTLEFLQDYTDKLAGLAARLVLVDRQGQTLADSEKHVALLQPFEARLPAMLRGRGQDLVQGRLQGRVGPHYVTSKQLENAPWVFIQIIEAATLSRFLISSQITYVVGLIVLTAFLSVAYLAVRRRKLEAALKESELRYGEVYNSTSEAIIIHDTCTGRMLEANHAFETMFGFPCQEAPRLQIADISLGEPPYGQAEAMDLIRRALTEGPQITEWRSRRRNGTHFWTEVALRATRIGGRDHCIAVVRDIDERKRSEAELVRYRSQLERLVEERTAALQAVQAELLRRERMATLGQLTATVSHELRNPLGTVANAVFTLRENLGQTDNERVTRALDLAQRNIQRCNQIITELLDFSRRPEMALQDTDLDPWLEAVVREQPIPEDVQVQWQLESGVTLPADRERLRRAVVNVITNALQAMQDLADKRLTVATRREADRVLLLFSDAGCGMGPEVLARIFEPLFSTKGFGVGLGMSIVKDSLEDQRGGVQVSSGPGRGTQVTLWLPLPRMPRP